MKNNLKLIIILLAVIALAIAGFAAYRVINKDKAGSQDSALTKEQVADIKAACDESINDETVCKFAAAFASQQEYKIILSTSGANGASVMTMEIDGKDSYVTVKVGDQTVSESITVGDTNFTKDPTTSTWASSTSTTGDEDVVESTIASFTEGINDDGSSRYGYKSLGKEACGNLTCFKYQITDTENSGDEQFIYFDDQDYLMRKWFFTGGAGETTATITYEDVNIEAPKQ